MIKKIVSITLATIFAVSMLTSSAAAAEPDNDTTPPPEGWDLYNYYMEVGEVPPISDGTDDDETDGNETDLNVVVSERSIPVRNAEELAAISGSGRYYLLDDIDLAGFDWKGISNFSGTLYGGLHTIKNLKSDQCGLFKRLDSGACIKNIRLEDVEIVSTAKTLGGIVSYIPSSAENITIDNCMVSGILCNLYEGRSRLDFCGAIAGVIASRDCTVTNCSSSATVEAVYHEGGIVGLNYGKISNSFFTGSLGCSNNDQDYTKKGMVIDEDGEKVFDLLYYVGGIAGGITSVNFGEISGCAVLLRFFDDHIYFGQISGINIKNKGSIKGCFTPQFHDPFDIEHYDDIANTLSSSEYSRISG